MSGRGAVVPLQGMALVALLAFSITAGHPPVVLALLGAAACACAWGGALHLPRSPLLLGGVLLGVAMLSMAGPPPTTHLFGPEAGKTGYGGGLAACIVLVLLLWRRNTHEESLLVMAVSLIVTLVAGVTREPFPYAGMAALEVCFLAWFLQTRLPVRCGESSRRRAAAVLVFSLLGAIASAWTLAWSETQLNSMLAFASAISDPLSASAAFAPDARLSSLRRMQESTRVVLRITSSSPPRYMVARRYTAYSDRTWHSERSSAPAPETSVSTDPDRPGLALATLPATWRPLRVDRVEVDPAGLDTLPIPADAGVVAAGGVELQRDSSGLPRLHPGSGFDGSYDVARGDVPPAALSETAARSFLGLGSATPPVVGRLARAATAGCSLPEEKARAVEAFLQGHCAYGFGYPFSEQADPVAEFLEKRPAAHCELFATSMVLMLRSLGIPSRYVTGFVVQRQGALGGYAAARVKDAHAWVEAWLPGRGWITFDPTPPGALDVEPWSTWEQFFDFVARQWGRLKGTLASWAARVRAWGSAGPAALAAVLFLAYALWRVPKRAWWRRGMSSEKGRGGQVDARLARLQALLRDFDRAMAARGWVRPRTLTLLEWAERLGEGSPAARFLASYTEARYRDELPDALLLERLSGLLRAVEAEAVGAESRLRNRRSGPRT